MANVQGVFVSPANGLDTTLEAAIGEKPDAIILVAYCSGTVPSHILPLINKATQSGIPVFSIRRTQDDLWYTAWSDYTEEAMPGRYESEVGAIALGMTPLQKDMVRLEEVFSGVDEICDEHPDYAGRVNTARERFSSPAWNERIDVIRELSI